MMTKDEIDRALATLSDAYDRIGVALYGVDTHPGLTVLRDQRLAGRTLAVSREVVPRVAALWGRFVGLGERLQRVQAFRAQRGRPGDTELAELSRQLAEAVVEVDSDGVPLDGQPGPPAGTVRLADLAGETERACAEVAGTLAEVDAAATAVLARLRPLDETMDDVRPLAADIGATEPRRRADALTADLAAARAHLTSDPLTAHGQSAEETAERLDRLAEQVSALRTRLRSLVELRADHSARLTRLSELVAEVASAETEAAQAFAAAAEKVAEPELPAAPSATDGLLARAAGARSLAERGRWTELDAVLADLDRSCGEALHRARQLTDAARGLLDRRAELRGRLTAYRAKAARLGFAEHPELSDCHRQVRDLLYVRPCDLTSAARAMFHYQQKLAELSGQPDTERRSSP